MAKHRKRARARKRTQFRELERLGLLNGLHGPSMTEAEFIALSERPTDLADFPRRWRIGNRFALGYADGKALPTPWPVVNIYHVHAYPDGKPKRVPMARLARVTAGGQLTEAQRAWWHMVGIGTTDTAQQTAWVSEGVPRNNVPESGGVLTPAEALTRAAGPFADTESDLPTAAEALHALTLAANMFLGTPRLPQVYSAVTGEVYERQDDSGAHGAPMDYRYSEPDDRDIWGVFLRCRTCGYSQVIMLKEAGEHAEELYRAGADSWHINGHTHKEVLPGVI